MSPLRCGVQSPALPSPARRRWPRLRFDHWLSPVAVPALLALAYASVLVARFPRLIRWENADSDVASAFTLTEAIGHGHTGLIVFGAQGSWASLAFGLITRGLGFHRVLWETAPILLSLAAAVLVAVTVARLAGRAAAVLTLSVLVAASPTVLANASAACFHNTTTIGTALLGGYLVWLHGADRGRRATVLSSIAVAIVTGLFLASDGLLLVDGLIPFVLAPALLACRRADRRHLATILGTVILALAVDWVTAAVTTGWGMIPNTQPVRLSVALIGRHLRWLVDGLLHIGGSSGGIETAPASVLDAAAAAITVTAIAVTLAVALAALRRPSGGRLGRARDLHVTFWAASLVLVSVAYVVTTVAAEPSDRYLTIAASAVAAVVPLLMAGRHRWIIPAAASILAVVSIVGLATDAERAVIHEAPAIDRLAQIESVVAAQRLGVGYAGYWDAAGLTWSSAGKLTLYPITDALGPTAPMFQNRAAAWYAPRAHTPSYVLLSPGDPDLSDRIPRGLPAPEREIRLGPIQLAVYPFDIARDLAAPYTP